jgi:hypothetical protein
MVMMIIVLSIVEIYSNRTVGGKAAEHVGTLTFC